jgi:Spy/CpxP family protein refolding chaperone
MKVKKVLIIGLPVLLTGLLISTLAFGFGRHRGHGMMKDFVMYKIDKVAEDLELNSAQQARWDTFKKDLASTIDQRKDRRKEIHDAVKQELEKSNPDFAKISPLVHGQIDSTAQLAHDLVNRINELLVDLTPEQKRKLSERIMELHEHHRD